ncbi:GNAT family N-acetyltransferase [Aquibacillus koreensis]|uniref:GNAT family N-acetyltransferase n=1 Tax=Aquibacillus koreensis TaxID=279446 RepID=A0A9X3WLE5_9BACI|nr:GNAT family N-acetyltransferase [Aquibacillus koreensis]MCT2536478.1 GNAT family N-acetyltransferase [Aquibacillus koreensis]MDC3419434.1 GNAT family N-acetyltransferase [Aquibacillus koreensis]
MNSKVNIQKIEELSLHALPALETQLVDGWIVRFSNGYTKRANSVNPLSPSNDEVKEKIVAMRNMYRTQNLKVVYKLTTNVFPENLDAILEHEGYALDGLTSVQLLPLHVGTAPPANNAVIYNDFDDKWFTDFCALNKVRETDRPTLKQMLQRIVPRVCYVTLFQDNKEPLACGMGVLEDGYIGLFDIVTNEKYRNKGYAQQLISTILHWGKEHGAKHAYLQVVLDNHPALNLYSKLGFKEAYRYWYRIER